MAAIQMRITFQFVSESNPEHIFDSVAAALFDQEAARHQPVCTFVEQSAVIA